MSEIIRVSDGKSLEDFTSYTAMAAFLGRHSTRHMTVMMPLGWPLAAKFVRIDAEKQAVLYEGDGDLACVPRRMPHRNLGVVVSAQPDSPNLVTYVHAEEYDSHWLDKGLVHIMTRERPQNAAAMIMAILPEHGLCNDKLADNIEGAAQKSRQFVDAVLHGDQSPPFSDYSARSHELIAIEQRNRRDNLG